ncbi:MAG: SDR family NAD(P)-dependent oxidoreductase [Cyclobacteriaceae bacterium]|nr:MAG: SDR family NAD(P)-dependent oxidoreductase [Cyclobacteriaceae bacterium]
MRKLIVVTGGTKGIGRAIADRFAQADFDVAVCARKADQLEKLKKDFKQKYPLVTVYTQPADMADRKQVETFVSFIRNIGQPVDVLVNNAGYFVPGSIATEKEGALEDMMNANLFSAYHMTRGIVDKMISNKSGHIFNMCSIASIKAYSNGGSYAITKFALLGFSKCLREELKTSGIRVTAILPGATRTGSWDGVDLPDERFMSAEDVAETVFAAWSLSQRSVVEEILIRPQLGDI